MLTKTQLKVILVLLDDKGHAGWEIADILNIEDSNLSRTLKQLENIGIICRGEPRKSGKQKKKEGDYKEVPYYLTKELNHLKFMISEIAQTDRLFETYFILEIIENSKYIEGMKKLFGDEVKACVVSSLQENYPPYSDALYTKIVEPQLVEEAWSCRSINAESVLWRLECLAIEVRCNNAATEDNVD